MNAQLARLLPDSAQLQIRLTATDSESVLKALVPHMTLDPTAQVFPQAATVVGFCASDIAPTHRDRTCPQSGGKSFILALEEPELHVAPGLQRQIVSEATSIANQTICTTHAPRRCLLLD